VACHGVLIWSTLALAFTTIGIDSAAPVLVLFTTPGSISTMQIFGPFRISTTQATGPVPRQQPQKLDSGGGSRITGPVDQLDLSHSVGRSERSSAMGGGEIRIDRVADLRRQIASGNYDTPERLDSALERMLDRFG
jgi:negative regulator of flagellin synthesis FlgM